MVSCFMFLVCLFVCFGTEQKKVLKDVAGISLDEPHWWAYPPHLSVVEWGAGKEFH